MASYKIEWKRTAEKELERIDKQYISKIVKAVEKLAIDSHPSNSKKLVGYKNIYRLRVGDYRVIYNIVEDKVIIEVIRVAHRKDVYKI
jgi:mRNA interferase RelE/StbE